MEFLIDLFLPISIWFQSSPDWMVSFFRSITSLGNTEFYILIMPALFWCIDSALGVKVGIMLLLSGGFNTIFKFVFQWPRPYYVTNLVDNLAAGGGYGFPSGHAQNAASVWGLIAVKTKQSWVRIISLALVFLIGFSRIVLGVHFTHDVLVGWLVGGVLLWLFIRFEESIAAWFKNISVPVKLAVVFLISIGFILVAAILAPPFNPPAVPPEWTEYAGEPLHPSSIEGLLTSMGALFGLGTGWVLLSLGRPFSQEGALWKRVLRYLVGIIGVLGLYMGLGSIFPDDYNLISFALRYLRYFLVGLWIAYVAPRFFQMIGLAEK